jgi:hypothetical protein
MMQLKLEQPNLTATRRQLQSYGLSKYQAEAITKFISPVAKQGSANLYDISEIIKSARQYLERPRIRQTTRAGLANLIKGLQERLGNVVEIPFAEGSDPEIRKLGARLMSAMSETDAALANLKADAAEIRKKYGAVK